MKIMNKKGQLGFLMVKEFFIGFLVGLIIGLIIGMVIVTLSCRGTLPRIDFLCEAVSK